MEKSDIISILIFLVIGLVFYFLFLYIMYIETIEVDNCANQCEQSGYEFYKFEAGTNLRNEACLCKNRGLVKKLW